MGFTKNKHGLETSRGVLEWGYPYEWMVYNKISHLEMDDDWGPPYDLENLHVILPHCTKRMD